MTETEHHHIHEIVTGERYELACICGWSVVEVPTMDDAIQAFDRHRERAERGR